MIAYPEVFRADYQTNPPTTPGPDTYLGSLQTGYVFFLILLTVHLLLILCFKLATRQSTRKFSSWSMMQQVLNTFSIPDANFDWIQGTGDISDYRQRRKRYLIEVMCESLLQWAVHMIMLVPLWIAGIH